MLKRIAFLCRTFVLSKETFHVTCFIFDRIEANIIIYNFLMLMIFAVILCYLQLGSSKWKGTWKFRPGAHFSKVPRGFRARKAIRKTTTCLFGKAGLFICCIGNKSKNNCKVSCLETPSFWRYKEYYVTRNAPEKFRDFRETGSWTGFKPWPLRCPCSALPELSYQANWEVHNLRAYHRPT